MGKPPTGGWPVVIFYQGSLDSDNLNAFQLNIQSQVPFSKRALLSGHMQVCDALCIGVE